MDLANRHGHAFKISRLEVLGLRVSSLMVLNKGKISNAIFILESFRSE